MRIFGIIGWSGSGKTTLVEKLLPELIRQGNSVSTLKHAHTRFDIDRPGKDTFRHREAGATEVMIGTSSRWALMHELRGEEEPTLDELVALMTPVDLLIVEGFKYNPHPKIEVHRPSVGKPMIQGEDPYIVAIASDERLVDATVPVLDINDAGAVAGFIIEHCRLKAA